MNKKIATAVLSASLIAASLGGYANAASAGFKDLNNVPGQAKILALHDKKIVNGVSATSFAPQSQLTQAEALQLIVKGFKLDEKTQTDALIALNTLFPSVKEDAWYANAFGYAYNNGVDIPKNVNPSAKITREQYIDYVMTGLQAVGKMPAIDVATPDIADLDKLNPEYLDSVQLAIVLGIAKPADGKNFNPTQEITRADAAVVLYNAVEYLDKIAADLDGKGTYQPGTGDERTIDILPGDKSSTGERTIDVLPHEKPASTPASGSYASPANGKFFSTGSVNRAIEEKSGKAAKFQVSVTLFENGAPIDPQSAKGKAELKRLQSLGYEIGYAKAWTYAGNLQKAEYTYISGTFTAEQLQAFKASTAYGYAFDFASNGDGSAVTSQNGAVTAPATPSLIAD
ncbi:S-layer homology domain-containing protein [Saccharibacillus sacchari]|uniref:S-layer homology domain-containing protein n=1 Tax=Saccharibacillus sacchari TaxID=456493 RepID=A0ACC6PFP9_9BACL